MNKMLLWIIGILVRKVEITPEVVVFFRENHEVVLALPEHVQRDAEAVAQKNYLDGLVRGQELGALNVMRYTKDHPKWEEIATHFKYDELNERYPKEKLPC